MLFFFLASCSHAPYVESDHYRDGKFKNIDETEQHGLWDLLKWKLSFGAKPWPNEVLDNHTPNFQHKLTRNAVAVTFINHATEVVQLENLTVITDPVFSERVSPFSWLGPKRHRAVGATLEQLPKIDVIIVSHNHYDHMDLKSLAALHMRDRPQILVPLGNKKYLADAGLTNITELDWWGEFILAHGKITLVPMQHWSSRRYVDRNESLWGGFVIQNQHVKILFTGDTGYGSQFKAIQEKFGPIDLSLLPIGGYEPQWFMKSQHMNPDDAVMAHIDLKSKQTIGMHFGTFQLTDEGIDEPLADLETALQRSEIIKSQFITLKNGETFLFPAKGISSDR